MTQGLVLCPEWWRQEGGTRAAEAAQRVVMVVVQQLGDIGGGLVMGWTLGDVPSRMLLQL